MMKRRTIISSGCIVSLAIFLIAYVSNEWASSGGDRGTELLLGGPSSTIASRLARLSAEAKEVDALAVPVHHSANDRAAQVCISCRS